MKLYYMPFACSLSPHIVAREAGIPIELVRVDRAKKTSTGEDYLAINPKGSVPALALDNGEVLTESAVIARFLADQKPELGLIPPAGTLERYRTEEWMNHIATDIHKQFSPLFGPTTPEETKAAQRETLSKRFAFVASKLEGREYLMGDSFTVADAYLFTVLSWTSPLKLDLSPWPALTAYLARVGSRPAVKAALAAEA